jgi:porin
MSYQSIKFRSTRQKPANVVKLVSRHIGAVRTRKGIIESTPVIEAAWHLGFSGTVRAFISFRPLSIVLSMLFMGLSNIQIARADSLSDSLSEWLSQPTLTGNWGGVRTSLTQMGISLHAMSYTEFADNVSGGKAIGNSTANEFIFGTDLDLGKLAGVPGGTVHILFADRMISGPAVSTTDIGNEFAVQNNFGLGEVLRLAQFSYEQTFDNGLIDTQAGFFANGNYFATNIALGCDFQNTAFCGHVETPFFNAGVTVLQGRWGGMLKLNTTPDTYIQSGIWDVNPTDALAQNSFKISFNGSTGFTVPVEFGWSPTIGPNKLPGTYKIGGYYDSSEASEEGFPKIEEHGKYGGYIMGNQMLFNLGTGTQRGLIAFAQGTISDKRTALIPFFYNFGLILQGPFSSRPKDYLAVGLARSFVNKNAADAAVELAGDLDKAQAGETDFEVDYGIQIAPWLRIHPNLEYITSPGAFSQKAIKNALTVGTQMEITY